MSIRIIPCLDIKDGRLVKGVQFADLKDAGDPIEIAKTYYEAGADELFLLDISASFQSRDITLNLVKRITQDIGIPLGVGGGINNVRDCIEFIGAGAKKISMGSAAIRNPELIANAAAKLGSQCITVAIDAKRMQGGDWSVYTDGGRLDTHEDVVKWAMDVEALGAGEILLTSIDMDGTKAGYDIELLRAVTESVAIPVIASGGAGRLEHFLEAITEGGAKAILAASLFHYGELEIGKLKEYLQENGLKTLGEGN